MSIDYKNTVFLPKTSFSMRANLPQKEPEILAKWRKNKLFEKMKLARKDAESFVIHDGPPYANGHIHIGHAYNKILKDVVNRTHYMNGKKIYFIPVWDCHGLPIEWKIEEKYRAAGKDKDEVPIIEFRQECREFAQHWLEVQIEEFSNLGLLGEWDKAQTTMSYNSEAQIAKEIGKFIMDGSLYRGIRPVMWSVVEKTALADAEVEYNDHKSPSIYVKFPVVASKHEELKGAFMVIWTTTPWSLPGNRAIAYAPDTNYSLIIIKGTGDKIIVASELLEAVAKANDISDYEVLSKYKGTDFEGVICHHPFYGQGYDFQVPLLPGEHVTTDAGTGLVHIAPGHGEDDFLLGRKFNLEVPQTIDDGGHYYDHIPLFAGKHVFKVNPVIIETLQAAGMLLGHSEILHSYPHSWRSKAPLIFRTTSQWFISMEKNGLRDKALKAIDEVTWFPERSKNRIKAMVADRPDWCISRQRAWGVPITIFVDKKTGEPLRDQKVLDRIYEAFEKEGADSWYTSDSSRFLSPEYKSDDFEQVMDVVDVWFDSGSTHAFVLENNPELKWPADLYLEGSDQHRGWFQTSLLESCGTRGTAPYKAVLTHGFVNDEKGYKMSKSIGNVVAPEKIVSQMGSEMLRLWVVNSDYTNDLRIGNEILNHQKDLYRRLRNTLRYLVGSLSDFDDAEKVNYDELPKLEKWVLHRLHELNTLLQESVDAYNFQSFFNQLHNFCSIELSAFYFDIRKDVLYCEHNKNLTRRAARTVFDHIFNCLTAWLAPVLIFTADEAWSARFGEDQSVHLSEYPAIPDAWKNKKINTEFINIRKIRRSLTTALERARADNVIGSSLQAQLKLYDPESIVDRKLDWADLAITSGIQFIDKAAPKDSYISEDYPSLGIIVEPASGEKCERCWKILEEVGTRKDHPELCIRCSDVVETMINNNEIQQDVINA